MRVILIEDDAIMGDMIKMYLMEEGCIVERVDTGRQGIELLEVFNPDIVITDFLLPDMTGTVVCREIREHSLVPIIIISMNTEVVNRIEALNTGADDYMCKPFSMKELVARMNAHMRRAGHERVLFSHVRRQDRIDIFADKKVVIEPEYRAIKVKERRVETTFTEFEIMKLLYNHPERVFTREEIIIHLRGINTLVNERSIDVHVMKLRNKIEEDSKNPKYIKTVWGIGYKFTP